MNAASVTARFREARSARRPLLAVLIDPENRDTAALPTFLRSAEHAGADLFFLGGSLTSVGDPGDAARAMKAATRLPVVLFPGGVHHITGEADAILVLSVVSGRNPDHLIGQHVLAAPIIRRLGIESIATAYLLVQSDTVSTAEFLSASRPLPRNKPDLAAAHAMAAEMLGMATVYLEAGSGAGQTVPEDMVTAVARSVALPVIVGGGIRSPECAASLAAAGADIIVVGNRFEEATSQSLIAAFADAVHDAGIRRPA